MMLVFDHVCVFYGDTPVLRELSFQVCSGEQVGLIGANGAGKSTLMKAALGLLPYTGSITVDGIPVTRKTLPEVRRKLGYVLQDADNQMFMPTVLDDMVFGPMNYGLSRAAAEQRAEETLAALHMEYLRNRHNHKMSGGEKRMDAAMKKLASDYLKAVAARDRLRLFCWCTANEGVDVRDASDFVACAGELLTEMLCMREKNPGIDRAEILRGGLSDRGSRASQLVRADHRDRRDG